MCVTDALTSISEAVSHSEEAIKESVSGMNLVLVKMTRGRITRTFLNVAKILMYFFFIMITMGRAGKINCPCGS